MIYNNESMIVCDKVSSLFLALHIRTTENDRYITFNGTYFSFKTFVHLNVLSNTNVVAINSNALFQKGQQFSEDQLCELKYGTGFQFRKYPLLTVSTTTTPNKVNWNILVSGVLFLSLTCCCCKLRHIRHMTHSLIQTEFVILQSSTKTPPLVSIMRPASDSPLEWQKPSNWCIGFV